VLTIVFLRQAENVPVIDVAHHHHIGIVRRIPLPVPVAGVLPGHVFEVVHPADDRTAVGMGLEHHRVQCFMHQRLRIVVGPQPPLLHHHLDLGVEFLGIELQIRHAVGFELHHLRQRGLRHDLEVGGVIAAGEGVVAAAGFRHALVEFARTQVLRGLEHQVFEGMGDAGRAVLFIHAAGAVPDHMHGGRRAAVFLDDDAQAIGKLSFRRGWQESAQTTGRQPAQQWRQAMGSSRAWMGSRLAR
jgi:hypothetical protein